MSISDPTVRLHHVLVLRTEGGEGLSDLGLGEDVSLEGLVFNIVEDLFKEVDDLKLQEVVPFVDLDEFYDVAKGIGSHEATEDWLLLELDHL